MPGSATASCLEAGDGRGDEGWGRAAEGRRRGYAEGPDMCIRIDLPSPHHLFARGALLSTPRHLLPLLYTVSIVTVDGAYGSLQRGRFVGKTVVVTGDGHRKADDQRSLRRGGLRPHPGSEGLELLEARREAFSASNFSRWQVLLPRMQSLRRPPDRRGLRSDRILDRGSTGAL